METLELYGGPDNDQVVIRPEGEFNAISVCHPELSGWAIYQIVIRLLVQGINHITESEAPEERRVSLTG